MKVTFNKKYFSLAILLFVIEVLIALFARDKFVRPYLGDVLVVILIYCFCKSFFKVPVFTLAIAVLIFAFTIEWLQYVHIVEKLGLEKSPIASTIIGTSFAWNDIIAYMAGIVIILVVEKIIQRKAG